MLPYSLDFQFFAEDLENGQFPCRLSITNTHPTAKVRNVLVDASQVGLSQPENQNLRRSVGGGDLAAELAELERRRINEALEQTGGNQTRAAELLGMPRRTLVKRIKQYNIRRPRE